MKCMLVLCVSILQTTPVTIVLSQKTQDDGEKGEKSREVAFGDSWNVLHELAHEHILSFLRPSKTRASEYRALYKHYAPVFKVVFAIEDLQLGF